MKLKNKILFSVFTVLLINFILLFYLNTSMIKISYRKHKSKILENTYNSYKKNNKLEEENNVIILKLDNNADLEKFNNSLRWGVYNKKLPLTKIWVTQANRDLLEKKEKIIIEYRQPKINASALILYFKDTDNKIIAVITPLIEFNEFFPYLKNMLFIFSSILSILTIIILVFILKKLIKPLYLINNISLEFSNLKFESQYDLKTNDEFDRLGESINILGVNLKKNIHELNSKIEEKEEFIRNAGHQLKTPLAIIGSYASAIKDNIIPHKNKFYLETIIEECFDSAEVIDNLLTISSLEETNIEEMVDLGEIIKTLEIKYINKRLDINYENHIENNLIFKGDRKKLQIAMDNIFSNIFKFSQKNVEVCLEVENKKTYLNFYNDGKNIENIDKIWDVFYTEKGEKNRDGSGLGMTIIKNILDSSKIGITVNNLKNGIVYKLDLTNKI